MMSWYSEFVDTAIHIRRSERSEFQVLDRLLVRGIGRARLVCGRRSRRHGGDPEQT
jgi:hypothetical protein